MADYGAIGAYLGGDSVLSAMTARGGIGVFAGSDETAWVMTSIPAWAALDGGLDYLGTTIENRRPVLIDALVHAETYGAQMAPDIAAVVGAGFVTAKKTLLAPWAFDYIAHQRERDALPNTTGAIRGYVEADAARVPYIKVHLYYNLTGEKIATTITDENGEYEFLGLAVGSTDYTVMASLDDYNNAVETRMAAVAA